MSDWILSAWFRTVANRDSALIGRLISPLSWCCWTPAAAWMWGEPIVFSVSPSGLQEAPPTPLWLAAGLHPGSCLSPWQHVRHWRQEVISILVHWIIGSYHGYWSLIMRVLRIKALGGCGLSYDRVIKVVKGNIGNSPLSLTKQNPNWNSTSLVTGTSLTHQLGVIYLLHTERKQRNKETKTEGN